ncbi:hypothetical protein PseudUWO311_00620 [Pseudanabaena sp. UWO311]|nr:hypothetical protein PseudUWO311_00620 [Pseudanabaena sp. UWO311]
MVNRKGYRGCFERSAITRKAIADFAIAFLVIAAIAEVFAGSRTPKTAITLYLSSESIAFHGSA